MTRSSSSTAMGKAPARKKKAAARADTVAGERCDLEGTPASGRLTALSTMASTMAHELSQPLAAATNYVDSCVIALRSTMTAMENAVTLLQSAGEQTARAAKLVRQMRSFVMSGKIEGRAEKLSDLISIAFATECASRGITLETHIDPAARLVLVDRVHIETVFANLFRNAAQAMAQSPRRCVTIHARALEGKVHVRFADTGIGVAHEHRDSLFDPSYTTRLDGCGLGLAICRTMLDAHGGDIWLDKSRTGEGAVFVVTLPAVGEPSANESVP